MEVFPPFSSYEKLDITVLDVNDNPPVFKEDPFISEILGKPFSSKNTHCFCSGQGQWAQWTVRL